MTCVEFKENINDCMNVGRMGITCVVNQDILNWNVVSLIRVIRLQDLQLNIQYSHGVKWCFAKFRRFDIIDN